MTMRDHVLALLPEAVADVLRAWRREAIWVRDELIASPRWALFCRRRGRENRKFFLQARKERAAGHDARLAPFRPADIPRIVWIYWDKGEERAPDVVRYCIRSWREHNPGWEVRVLDREAAEKLADLSVVAGKDLPQRFHANVLRLQLLSTQGGVWADATLLCHRPLDDWLPYCGSTGFFAFTDAGPDRLIENWFIASTPNGDLVRMWRDIYVTELSKAKSKPRYYFVMIYAFAWALRRDRSVADAWARCVRVPASPCLMAASALQGRLDRDLVIDVIRRGLPLSKLTWKADISRADVEGLVADARGPRSVPLPASRAHVSGRTA